MSSLKQDWNKFINPRPQYGSLGLTSAEQIIMMGGDTSVPSDSRIIDDGETRVTDSGEVRIYV